MAVKRELPADAVEYAAGLYAVLHELDTLGLDQLVIESPPEDDMWLAIRDRLRRASQL
jgi:L-threonylcarbamoyladenylate synthase